MSTPDGTPDQNRYYVPPPPPPQGAGGPGRAVTPGKAMKDVSMAGWGLLGAALMTTIAGFLPWWSMSVSVMGYDTSDSVNGWHRFWWIGLLAALGVGATYGLSAFKVIASHPKMPVVLVYSALGSFVVTLLAVLDTVTLGSGRGLIGSAVSAGPSFGVFAALVATGALAYFAALVGQESGVRLPITVKGPLRR
ncbi:hypothetical protein FK531_09245 [Rhodococcus spelaei]|uniref:Uncharacterized protein n=1 Tax=Rhodococcus spelaei TaxID=2546320 RepID=A0A541BMT8_9NOCA|nr:hypothetical protein [Rhodococcus spelaei]TQF73643.1 hypothetical protein FK531_09245 [Rhodococcus spelaei]